jgi:pyridoxamine 5'-phosphate oxidase
MFSPTTRLPLEPPENHRATEKPVEIFATWFAEAKQSGIKEPSAVFLATATKCGAPSCRVVLLKEFNEDGFVIYTNMGSRKGREIEQNPQAALCFYWQEIGRQVRVEGYVSTVSNEEADAYFASRPLKSRIGAWASKQSEPLGHKSELLKRVAYYTAQWVGGNVKRPPHWTGLRIVPDHVEFWHETPADIPERKVFYLRENVWYEAMLQP